ncbi:NK-tumor recognition protein isoform X5 [Procambarus clarkii]|uniref:NK-tumor recognition protein isoform X5 n=1 Tax=Procambarus clarkii TaxID=6728 RepID=UPI003743828D
MGDTESNKTSDEIINELFSSLNVPLSPKPQETKEDHDKEGKLTIDIADSDNSEDDESDSKSSGSDEEVKSTSRTVQGEAQDEVHGEKIGKRKSQRKKKDKKKKKRRRRKKGDGGRHKHKKRKKKENIELPDDQYVSDDLVEESLDDQHISGGLVQEPLDDQHISGDLLEEPVEDQHISGELKEPVDQHISSDLVQEPLDDQHVSDDLVREPPDDHKQEAPDAQHVSDKLVQEPRDTQHISGDLVRVLPDSLVQDPPEHQHLSANTVQKSPEYQRLSADLMHKPPEDEDLSSCLVFGTELKNQILIKKLIVQEEMKKALSPDVKERQKNISKSEKLKLNFSLKSVEIDTKNKILSRCDVDKDESQAKHGKNDQIRPSKSRSPALPVSQTVNNIHSRPEPLGEARQRSPKSRSRSQSRRTENSRSRSKSKFWHHKSRTKSPKASESHKRSSRSHSRSLTPKHVKKRRSSKSHSRSSSRRRSRSKRNSRSRSKRNSRSASKRNSRSRSKRNSRSRSKRNSRSRSKRSSRSRSKRNSRSRSKRNSRCTSKRNSRSSSKRNSRSSSKRNSRSRSKRNSRSRSKRNSRSGSNKTSRLSSKRNSRSRSKINSRSISKRNSRSRSQSKVKSQSDSKRNSRSRSTGNSRSRSKRKSRSKSPKKSRSRSRRRSRSQRRSVSKSKRSNSKSPKISSFSNETCNLLDKIAKNSTIAGELKGVDAKNLDLNCIPPPDPGLKARNSSRGVIALESIPLPIPTLTIPDPSSIPLPQPLSELDGSLKELKSVDGVDLDLKAIPVPVVSGDVLNKEQDSCKTKDCNKAKQEEGSEKGKAKTIIIKSLKDSLVFLQAQEEAERRAKEIANHHENSPKDTDEKSTEDLEEKKDDDKRETSQEKNVEEGAKKDVSNIVNDLKVEITEVIKDKKEIIKTKQEAVGNKAEELEDKEETKKSKVPVTEEVKKNGEQKDDDIANGMEEGEIASEDEEPEDKPALKSHSKKKSKKNKNKSKEKRKSRKDKEKSKDDKKRGRERSRSHERDKTRSRSREKHKSRRRSSSSRNKDRDYDRRHRRHSRSRSRDRSSRLHRKRSRSRSKSRSRRTRDPTADLRDKVTRKRLLEIARRNAVYLMQNGCLPPSVEQEQLVKIKAGGKSVDELTDFCKQLVASGNYSDVDLSDPSLSSGDDNENIDKPFSTARHPFSIRDAKPILMNIRNAPMLPTKTNAERLAGQAKLREQFPVSSGSQHRTKGELTNNDGKHQPESDWVPVPPKEKKEEDKVFPQSEPQQAVDISQIVSTRLSAMRKLQDNPHDSEAIKTLHNVQKEMQNWALSKQEPAPGQFTGTTGVKVLSQEELSAGHQAWARKEQLKEAAPIKPQFGLKMLQKMGWSPGEGLGKNKEGTIEPLLLDVKMDKKGFHAQEELTPKKQPIPLAKDLSGKHPVSALVELCSKRKWSPPDFEMVFDCGPDHKKNFLMKVMVNGQEFKPSVAASTKKMAKANAAAAYLQSLGLFPKDPNNPLL